MKIPLQSFCADADAGSFSRFAAPFVKNGWEYATDGRIMVRVKCEKPDTVPLPKTLEDSDPTAIFSWWSEGTGSAPWPSDAAMLRLIQACPNEIEVHCAKDCPLCRGKGEFEQDYCCTVGDHIIAAKYHALIKTLPNARYRTDILYLDPLPFEFDGGVGLVMGLRNNEGAK